jgi:hypothetical protein
MGFFYSASPGFLFSSPSFSLFHPVPLFSAVRGFYSQRRQCRFFRP